ncbi:hypothetical protein P154DRAFT_359007 [Amniculicola lignicola CBS 123094]|uniref:Uncharacterized protein n=1 Tax=Amniculicola lignicola CBS 123094 TaxID=1392246 RepID=A0A6A5VZB1_9PLEO|nr:hypothetical protein P154DRAFT_359007 [Amniculicola lignicola CBS 123094]
MALWMEGAFRTFQPVGGRGGCDWWAGWLFWVWSGWAGWWAGEMFVYCRRPWGRRRMANTSISPASRCKRFSPEWCKSLHTGATYIPSLYLLRPAVIKAVQARKIAPLGSYMCIHPPLRTRVPSRGLNATIAGCASRGWAFVYRPISPGNLQGCA